MTVVTHTHFFVYEDEAYNSSYTLKAVHGVRVLTSTFPIRTVKGIATLSITLTLTLIILTAA